MLLSDKIFFILGSPLLNIQDSHLKPVEGAVIFHDQVFGVADREEVSILTDLIGYMDRLH